MTKRQFIRRCHQLGVVAEDTGMALNIYAPVGKRLIDADGPHWTGLSYSHGEWSKPEMYAELMEDMEGGVHACTDPDCEWCADCRADGSQLPSDVRACDLITGEVAHVA